MSNDIVRYNNGLNSVALRNFTPIEMDIFWSICSKMKRKGTQQVEFEFEIFKELSKFERTSMESFHNALKSMGEKLGRLNFVYEDERIYEQMWLFQRFAIDKINEKIIIQANERFEFILNSIGSNFTRFELENMTTLSSTYSKELYRQLMQHRDLKTKKGAWFVTVDEFRELLCVPKSFRMTNIDKRIFEQARAEFITPDNDGKVIFSTFEIEKVKARKGNKIASFRIYFQEPTLPIIPIT